MHGHGESVRARGKVRLLTLFWHGLYATLSTFLDFRETRWKPSPGSACKMRFWVLMNTRVKRRVDSLLKFLLSATQLTNLVHVTLTCKTLWPNTRFTFINWPLTPDGKKLSWPLNWLRMSFLLLCGSQLCFTMSNSNCDYTRDIILCLTAWGEEKNKLLLSLKGTVEQTNYERWDPDSKQNFCCSVNILWLKEDLLRAENKCRIKKKGKSLWIEWWQTCQEWLPAVIWPFNGIVRLLWGRKDQGVFQLFATQKT